MLSLPWFLGVFALLGLDFEFACGLVFVCYKAP